MSLSPGTRLLCRMNVLSGGAGCGKPPGAASRPNSLTRLGAGRALGRLLVEGEPQSQDPVAQRRAARTPPPPPRAPYSWAFSSGIRQTGLHEASETTGVLCANRESEALGGLTAAVLTLPWEWAPG